MRGWRIRGALVSALLAGAIAPGPAVAVGLGPTTRVTVKPGSGTPQTHFALHFRIPVATGRFGTVVRTDTVSVTGPGGAHCQSAVRRTLRPAKKGKRVTVTLRPGKGRGGWCAGQWHGTVLQSVAIRCNPTPAAACPQLVVAPQTIATFRFRVKPAASHTPPAPASDVPTFAGLVSATTCSTPPPMRPELVAPRSGAYTLTWAAATDPVTPSAQLVYEIFMATSPGAEDYATPTYTTSPGATSFVTPLLLQGTRYFVVRARNAAGHEDPNTVERQGVFDCPPVHQPQRAAAWG
jgi:hypothetical protein